MSSLGRYLSNDSIVGEIDEFGEIDDVNIFQRPAKKYHRYSLDLPGIVTSKFTQEQPQGGGVGPKLVVAMVGLPARGKSYIVKKLERYLTWLQYETKIFNVGNLRRSLIKKGSSSNIHSHSFFDSDNEHAKKIREQLAMDSLEELIDWLKKGGRVGILDATNSTIARRKKILERCQREPTFKILFIESICNEKKVLDSNMRLKLSGPDYKDMDPEEALEDFRKRVANYEKSYESISEEEEKADIQYCKIINVGKKIIAHNIQGFLSGQCIFYLMNFNLVDRQIWLTRHGESTDNTIGRLGGDSLLSKRGRKFGACLSRFIHEQKVLFRQRQLEKHRKEVEAEYPSESSTSTPEPPERNFLIWTSMLKRTIETIENFDPKEFDIMHIRFLNEIYAGIFEEMTYREIENLYPEEYNARKNNKLYYRYPGMGSESYLDVIHRVNPLIIELERMTNNILIVTHQVVLRILLAYFLDIEKEKVPNMDVPLHTVYCLEPKAYGTELKKWKYDEEQDWFFQIE